MSTKYQPDFQEMALPKSLDGAKTVYHGSRFSVMEKDKRSVVIHPGAVIILPFIKKDEVLLIRNERFAVGKTLWELPAGTLEKNEHPQVTAERELIEETGYSCKKIEFLNEFYTTPGFCNEKMYAYRAYDLSFVGQNLDETEKITVEPKKFTDCIQMIKTGEICDGKTIATLLYHLAYSHS